MLLFAAIPVTVLELGKLVRPLLTRRRAGKPEAGHEERT
jgi:hypothetical protein